MKLKKQLAVLLCLIILTVSFISVGCDGDAVRKTREQAEALVIYSDAGVSVLDEIKASGALAGREGDYEVARTAITEIRDTTALFVEKVRGFTKFDAKSRQDLAAAFEAVTSSLVRLKGKIAVIVPYVIDFLNARGITNIKDPQSVVSRINLAITGLDITARLIKSKIAP